MFKFFDKYSVELSYLNTPLYNAISETQAQTHLAKQCCSQANMYTLYRKMIINGHFLYIIYTFKMHDWGPTSQ